MLVPGDPVPSLVARGLSNPRYALDSVAGRHVVLSFIGGTAVPGIGAFVDRMTDGEGPFDDRFACLFLVSADPADEAHGRLRERYPGIRVFWDADGTLARAFGALTETPDGERLALGSWILRPDMRVADVLPMTDPATHADAVFASLAGRPDPSTDVGGWAPVLAVPDVLEPALCRDYLDYAAAVGTADSGFMRTDADTGETVMVVDHRHKRRSDCVIDDARLRDALQGRVRRRIVPAIEHAFQFRVTRMERYIVARYDADAGGGWFRPHKDNTTLGTAHRRFAVSIGLDADAYDGGDLRFPEFGMRRYRPTTGGAIVFSCSLLHEVLPVTGGRRHAILPFLYDDAAAALRLENARHLQDADLRDSVVASVTGDGRALPMR